MALAKNVAGNPMPHPEGRSITGTLTAVNSTLDIPIDGDNAVAIQLTTDGATATMSYEFLGSIDGVEFFPILAYSYSPFALGGVIPLAAIPMISESISAVVRRAWFVAAGQLSKIRIRISAYTTGVLSVTMRSDINNSIHAYVLAQRAATHVVSVTGAANSAVTATLPAVTGLRHYIDRIDIIRSTTAATTASATPMVVTSTNLPGALAFTFGVGADAIGTDKLYSYDPGSAGISATAVGAATTVVAPAYSTGLWRINVTYRLGI